MTKYLVCLAALLALAACDEKRIYEQNRDLAGNQWYIDTIPSFTFRIADASKPYNIYFNVRNAISYPYYNLYVTYYLQDSTGKQIESRLQEWLLADSKTGKPLGEGLGDIFDHRIISRKNFRFPYNGTYTFRLKQYMRQDPLPFIMSVGVRVEKVE